METRRHSAWARWKALAVRAAEVQSNVLLFVLYVVLFVPLALLRRPFGDPLGLRGPRPGWRPRPKLDPSVEAARRQF
jgi:hypothetical protein